MQRQCKNCGDYFKTSQKYRKFCSIRCAHLASEINPMYTYQVRCFLCPEKVDISVIRELYWDGELHEVCPMCASELAEQGIDSFYSESVSTLLE